MRGPLWVKPGIWGAVIGAVAMMIIGFSWMGWVLGSTAEDMAKERAKAALVAAFAPMCADRFMAQADAQTKLGEFQNQCVAATGVRGTLLLDSRVLRDQQLNERRKQRFASLSHVVNELEKPQVEREFLL